MNYFLLINRKLILFCILFLSIAFCAYLFIMNKNKNQKNFNLSDLKESSNYDILKPKFIINNKKNTIQVSANQGDFVKNDNILLKQDVLFESKDFTISSNKVLYNKIEQTAKSRVESIFESEKTHIRSQGFDIIDQGNIIIFNGKSKITLSK